MEHGVVEIICLPQPLNTVPIPVNPRLYTAQTLQSRNRISLRALTDSSAFFMCCGVFLFLVSWGGVTLSPPGTSTTNWPIVPAPTDRWWWMWSSRCNENWQGKPKYSEKTCLSDTLYTVNPILPYLGSNPGRRGGKPGTNRLSYGMALQCIDSPTKESYYVSK
jgi:hypothetical protein